MAASTPDVGLSALLIAALHGATSPLIAAQMHRTRDDNRQGEVAKAIVRAAGDFWSLDASEASAAKEALIGIGPAAIPTLVSMLDGLTNAPLPPHYPFGSYDRTGVSHRVQEDVCEILGQLRAVEAVPLLIRVIERRGPPIGLLGRHRRDERSGADWVTGSSGAGRGT